MKWLTYGNISSRDVYTAIEKGEFYTVYQPIVCLQTWEIDHYECLARWDSMERFGFIVPPNIFTEITTLEANRRLTTYLMDIALRDEQALEKPVHFNLSYYDLFQMPAKSVKNVELVESYFADDALPLLNRVTNGRQLWLDDVGSGASAWQHIPLLKHLHGIKLDAYLIKQIDTVNEPEACRKYIRLISKIVEFCKEEGILIVAECIENSVQHQILKELQVDFGQGYFYHKPECAQYWTNYKSNTIKVEIDKDLV